MTLFSSRNYHRLAVVLLVALLFSYGPYFAQESLGGMYVNATLFESPAADDVEVALAQRAIFGIGLFVVLLLSQNEAWMRVGALLSVSGTAVILLTQLFTILTPAFGFNGNYLQAYGLTGAVLAFGVVAVVNEGGVKNLLPFRDLSESDPLLNIAVIACDAYAVLISGNVLLRYREYASVFPEAARPALDSVVVEGLSRYWAVFTLAQVGMRAVLYRTGTRHERSAIAAVILLSMVYASEIAGSHRIFGDTAFYMRTLMAVLLAVGIRRNQDVSGPSFSLTLRNALWMMVVFNVIYHVQSSPSIVAAFWDKWHGAKALSFATPLPFFFYGLQHSTALRLLATGWIVFVHDHEAASRAALLSLIVYVAVWTLIFMIWADSYGFSTVNAGILVVQNGAAVTLAVKALVDSLHGQSFGNYFRSVFAWSYSPLKGGVYLAVLQQLYAAVIMFLPTDPVFTAGAVTEVSQLFRFGFAVTLLLSALSLYVVTRVADRALARSLLLFSLAANLYSTIIVPFAKQAPGVFEHLQNYSLGRTAETVVSAVMVVGLFASLYIDSRRAEASEEEPPRSPRTPRGGRRRKAE